MLRKIDPELGSTLAPTRMWLKVIFLVLIIGGSMWFLTSATTQNRLKKQETMYQDTLKPSISSPTGTLSLKDVQKNGEKLANNTFQQGQKVAGSVLGDVSERVENAASDSAQFAVDYAYRNTFQQVILKMIESMPEHQQEEFKKRMCE